MVRSASAVIISLVMLAGCDQPKTPAAEAHDSQFVYDREHPAGRYQMLAGPNGRVYLLDTSEGDLKMCALDPNETTIGCTNTVVFQP